MTTTTAMTGRELRLEGHLDPHLSRWLWLVKMFLAIPHFIVLAFLWIGFIVATAIAGVAILITGRYPRTLFDFNVGVLRWNWRVGFYVWAALGTDKYPPFTLAARADYPAQFDISYTGRLSRGLVLVKWALAIPHLLIAGLLLADLLPYPWAISNQGSGLFHPSSGYSVLNLIVVLAGVCLLINRRYPPTLLNLVLGINRWLYQVLTYVALMHDDYPSFRSPAQPLEDVGPDGGSRGPTRPHHNMKLALGITQPLPIVGFRVEQRLPLGGVSLEPGDHGIGD